MKPYKCRIQSEIRIAPIQPSTPLVKRNTPAINVINNSSSTLARNITSRTGSVILSKISTSKNRSDSCSSQPDIPISVNPPNVKTRFAIPKAISSKPKAFGSRNPPFGSATSISAVKSKLRRFMTGIIRRTFNYLGAARNKSNLLLNNSTKSEL